MSEENMKIVVDCPLCGNKELNVILSNNNLMQCISCGYSTSDEYSGNIKDNIAVKKLDQRMREWSKEKNGQIWVPSILNLPIGIFYPIDKDGEMAWAFAPVEKLPENEQEKYPVPGQEGKFYTTKYDTDNQVLFDSFGRGIVELEMIIQLREKSNKESSDIELPKLKKTNSNG